MTERKPVNLSFTSWIDQQIDEASQRGAFDDLPGAGRCCPGGPQATRPRPGCRTGCAGRA